MDTIAAIATGPAAAAIGVVRVSGQGCFACCDRLFRAASQTPFSRQEPRKMVFGEMLDAEGRVIDRGLAVRFPAPHSYTGEDSAELHCHGSPVVLRELLSALFAAGARQAGPGEFTKRAFLNGRLDLTQAEAVIDLIDAETAAAARNAAAQLEGGLRRVLEPIQETLLDIASRFYAVVDYPDEDIQDVNPAEIARAMASAEDALTRLLAACRRGQVLKKGVPTAIVGRPNVGKSSLLNALLGYERAIVTDIPGTTRDTVEESVLCGGVLLRLIDTAGLRETEDTVEQLGVERSRRAMEEAELILLVDDTLERGGQRARALDPRGLQAGPHRAIRRVHRRHRGPGLEVSRRIRLPLRPHRGGHGGPGESRSGPFSRWGQRRGRLPSHGPPPGAKRPPPGPRRPGGRPDPRRRPHRCGGGPGRLGGADRPHRQRGAGLRCLLPVLRGKIISKPVKYSLQNHIFVIQYRTKYR